MRIFKLILAALGRFAGAIGRFPGAVKLRMRVSRRLLTKDRAEAERIDRIRHPDKYRGK